MTSSKSMEGIGARLMKALEYRTRMVGMKEVNKKAFATAMQLRFKDRGGQKGVGYVTVLAYLAGDSVPSLEWLAEAADVLHVRFEWLAVGSGKMTSDEELIARHEIREKFQGINVHQVVDILVQEFPEFDRSAEPGVYSSITSLWSMYCQRVSGPKNEELFPDSLREVCQMLLASARSAGIDLWALPVAQLDRYLIMSAEACKMLLTTQDDVAENVPVRPGNEGGRA